VKLTKSLALGFGLGVALLSLGGAPARAQVSGRFPGSQPANGRNGRGNGSGLPQTPGVYPGPNGTQVRVLPPESLGPNSLGLIERDFQRMRATSSDPDNFLYGRWNPRYEVINPPAQYYPSSGGYYGPGYCPPGGYYPQAGYGYYGGYGSQYYGGNSGYAGPQTVIQREYVVIQEDGGDRDSRRAGEAAGRGESGNRKPAEDDFYLRGRADRAASESLSDALDDIRKAWLNGDFERLRARFKTDGKVRIYPRGQYKYSVDAKEFAAMLKDAMIRIDTISFELDRPRSDSAGRVLVTGKHVFIDADKTKHETYVSYGLERADGKWRIVEAGSSSQPITRHEDVSAGPNPDDAGAERGSLQK
jgi:hypothetical protein